MNKLTWYTIISAFWVAFLAVLGVNLFSNTVIHGNPIPPKEVTLEKFGYPIEVVEEAPSAAVGEAGPGLVSSLPLIAAATVEEGAAVFKKCAACHTIEPGGANKTGPNLHDMVGASIGDHAGFKTTESLKAIGGTWTYERLDDYLENPKRLAPKGSMSFAGLKKPQERAAVIKYMMVNTSNPPPVPAAAEAPAAEPAADAAAPAEAPAAAPAAPAGN
jgi:cytochrome c